VNGVAPIAGLALLTHGRSRSISPENPTGEPNAGGRATSGTGAEYAVDLGQGWKISPSVRIEPTETYTMAEIDGPGSVKQLWLTATGNWRLSILRVYWDDQEHPSIECPLGDFFGMGWGRYTPLSSLAVCVNPGSAFNCYWEMPFRKRARFTLTSIADEAMVLYYQLNYELLDVPDNAAYLHARFNRVNPLPYKDVYTVVDGVEGVGHYVGTYVAWGVHNNGWWGEGEIKFFIDGDDWPTICGTGTEDYFCGSYNFENQETHQYEEFTTPYAGLHQVIRPDGPYCSQQRFGMYRWHITDPIRFRTDLRVTLQALGWRPNHTAYLPLQDDIASVAYWYQTLPSRPLPALPGRDDLEVI
jgi:D-arabinan exo alpha-(1,3)/(1,5)-arabinofuranosidase (non-reducing end)